MDNISFELAKQLKDAGFPQKGLHWNPNIKFIDQKPETPTLSELIEACGDRFLQLQIKRAINSWSAWAITTEEGIGSSPEEAVARLWLALKKK